MTTRNRLTFSVLAVALSCLLLATTRAASAQPFANWATFGITPGGYIRVSDSASLDPTTAMTIEAWVYIEAIPSGSCVSLVGKNWETNYWVGLCSVGSPEVPQLRSYLHGTSSQMTGGRIYLGRWNHVAVTWDGTMRRHYVNGDPFLEAADSGPRTPNNDELRIGSDVRWQVTPQAGIDEVRLWSVARTTGQLREAINTPIPSAQAGLVSVWNMNGIIGADEIGANPGVVAGDVRSSGYSLGNACPSDATTHCFGRRFKVSVEWRLADGTTGEAQTVPGATEDSGLFYFFSPTNWELLVKALDGCPVNGKRWVFSAATTNVAYTLVVFDTRDAEVKRYINALNVNAPAVNDVAAFACP